MARYRLIATVDEPSEADHFGPPKPPVTAQHRIWLCEVAEAELADVADVPAALAPTTRRADGTWESAGGHVWARLA